MDKKKLLRIIGYVAFAALSLMVSLYLTFPSQAVGQRLAHEIRKVSGGKLEVTFDDVSIYRFTGIAAEGVKLRTIPEQGDPMVIELDELWLRLQILPLVLLDIAVSGGVEVGEGTIDVDVTKTGDGVKYALEVDDLDLTKPPVLSGLIGMPLRGKLAGTASGFLGLKARRLPGGKTGGMELNPEDSEGTVEVTLNKAFLGPGIVQGFTIPAAVSLGKTDLALEMGKGRARIASFANEGGQVALDLGGSMNIRRTLRASTLDTCVKMKFTDETYLEKYPKIKTALQLAEVQLKKDGEGFLNLKLGGTVARPRRQRGVCRSFTPGRKAGGSKR